MKKETWQIFMWTTEAGQDEELVWDAVNEEHAYVTAAGLAYNRSLIELDRHAQDRIYDLIVRGLNRDAVKYWNEANENLGRDDSIIRIELKEDHDTTDSNVDVDDRPSRARRAG